MANAFPDHKIIIRINIIQFRVVYEVQIHYLFQEFP